MILASVPVSLAPVGILLGCTYAVVISSIVWWMLHVPEAGGAEQKVARVVREAASYARILVPVQGGSLSDRMVALACQMAKYRHAQITLLYVIEVPLTLPGNASMPDDERRAAEAFKRATGIAERYGVKMITSLFKTRQAGPGIVQTVNAGRYDVVLMGDVPRRARGGTEFARSVEYVHEHASSEVIIYRPAPA